ncbi:MAG: hypothetical protein ABID79_04985 [Elusimicrobiota bacterium]
MFQSKTLNGNLSNIKNIKLLFIILILLSAGLLRFSLLFTAHQYPSGDESLAGMMAKQLIEDGKISIKHPSVAYSGGLYIEAYIIALSFKIFGISNISLKIPIVLLSLLSLLLVTLIAFKVGGIICCIILGAIYGFCPIFIRWNLLVWCGYIETLIFIPFLILIFLEIYKKSNFENIIFLGFVSAVAFWNQPIILSFVVALALLIFFNSKFGLIKAVLYIFISILPRLIVEIPRKSSVFIEQHIPSVDFKNFFSRFIKVFYFDMPAFFSTDNVDNFPDIVSPFSYFWFIITLVAVLSTVIGLIKSQKDFHLGEKLTHQNTINLLLLSALGIHIIFYSLTKMGGTSPRYLLPAGFCLIMILAFYIYRLITTKKSLKKTIGYFLLILICFLTVAETLVLFREKRTVHDLRIISTGKDLVRAINFLKANDYKYVYANYFLQWRIMFESKGEIIVSSDNLMPMVYPYPEYEKIVDKAKKFAYVVNTQDPFKDLLLSRFNKMKVMYKIFDS